MINTRLKPVALALALCALGPAVQAAQSDAATIQENVTVTAGKTISQQEEAAISSAGAKVLHHITQARAAIHRKDVDTAKAELNQAEKLLDIIQAALPTSEVTDRIWVAKKDLEYNNTEEVLPDLIPIYTSLDELVDIMPTDSAKAHLDKARAHLKSGDKDKAKASLDATAAALQYTEVDLPLGSTRQLVMQARADLEKQAQDSADKALKSAEDHVVFMSVALEQPLFTAKALLGQAGIDLDAGDTALAASDLQGAIGYLEIAAQSKDKAVQEDATQLLADAKALHADLESGSDISAQLRHLWQHTHALADRSMEYVASGWARYRAHTPLKSDLIEAKLHLANARIDLFTGHEPGDARKELSRAQQYIDQAVDVARQRNSDTDLQKRIEQVQSAVNDLSGDPANEQQASYLALQQQLADMIRSL